MEPIVSRLISKGEGDVTTMFVTSRHHTCQEKERLISATALWRASMLACVVLFVSIHSARGEHSATSPLTVDPAKVVGADQCARCHQAEVQQWIKTAHFTTFDSLHRTPQAKQIAERLGERSIKRSALCTQCHYTQQQQEQRLRVVAGVSCESCHGAAADWLTLHADYGGEGTTRETESAEHRATRIAESISRGMNNPHNMYLIARQCYGCHTTPNERLVNSGEHVAGSADFELVAWSQGSVRHNFLRGDGSTNPTPSPDELRVMFVVGVMTDLEYSLRAVAAATVKATFGITSAQRAARMKRRLHEIQKLLHDPLLQRALDAVATVELRLGNAEAITSAADEVGRAAYEFAARAERQHLAAVDPLLPAPAQYR